MGIKFSKRRDASVDSAETAAAAQEPAATQPAEDSVTPQTQEAVKTENEDVGICLPTEECVSECREVEALPAPAPPNDTELESAAKETPAPVSEPSPAETEPVAEAQLAPKPDPEPAPKPDPEPAPEPDPKPDPEPAPEPEPTSNSEAEVEAVPEPISESVPAPAEALEQQTDLFNQEPLPEPVLCTPPLIDMGVPDATPQPMNAPPSPAPIPTPVHADMPSDMPVTEECQASAEVSVISTFELEKSDETSGSLDKLMEVEAAGDLEQLVSDVTEESVSGLLKNLELKGNDLVTDLIPTDVKIPDDTPITDMSTTSTELM